MKIVYRYYQNGDETALAELFNRCFTQSGPGFQRSPSSIIWRYVSRPGADLEEIQIAQDESGDIVGAVYSTLEDYTLDSNKAVIGAINDVTVDPNYTHNGIARELMHRAIQYFENKNCAYAILTADPNGFARKKLYIPLGWQDLCPEIVKFSIFSSILRYLPGLLGFFPLWAFQDLVLFLQYNFYHRRYRHRKICDIAFTLKKSNRTQYQQLLYQIRDFHNIEAPSQYVGKIHFGAREWEHFRMQIIPPDITPNYVILFHGDEIIAYACFFVQKIHFPRIHRHIPLAIVRDYLISSKKISHYGLNFRNISTFLRLSLLRSARHHDCGAMLIPSSEDGPLFMQYFHFPGFMQFKSASIMIKSFGNPPLTAKLFPKPFKISGGEMFLFP